MFHSIKTVSFLVLYSINTTNKARQINYYYYQLLHPEEDYCGMLFLTDAHWNCREQYAKQPASQLTSSQDDV